MKYLRNDQEEHPPSRYLLVPEYLIGAICSYVSGIWTEDFPQVDHESWWPLLEDSVM